MLTLMRDNECYERALFESMAFHQVHYVVVLDYLADEWDPNDEFAAAVTAAFAGYLLRFPSSPSICSSM